MKRKYSDKGFTLIEVMIALVVLLLGMLGVMGMQYYAVTGNASSRELRLATNLSQQLVEQMKSTPYANLATNGDVPVLDQTTSGGVAFQRAWWVVPDCVGLVAFPLGANVNVCAGGAPACISDPDAGLAVQVSAFKAATCWQDKNANWHYVTLDSLRWNENVVP